MAAGYGVELSEPVVVVMSSRAPSKKRARVDALPEDDYMEVEASGAGLYDAGHAGNMEVLADVVDVLADGVVPPAERASV